MSIYNCKHSGDQYQITKFNRDGEIESSYLCDHVQCQCPAGQRPSCRHRQMLPTFLTEGLVNSNLFLDWDNGRRVVDFDGQPATVQSFVDETIEPNLAAQALTDTGAQSIPGIEGVTFIDLDDPHAAHNAIATVLGEPTISTKPATSWRRF